MPGWAGVQCKPEILLCMRLIVEDILWGRMSPWPGDIHIELPVRVEASRFSQCYHAKLKKSTS